MNTDKSLTTSILGLSLATGIILLVPLIAMQFTEEVIWTLSDFVIAGLLLFGTGLTYILVKAKSSELTYRIAVGFGLISGFFLLWVNLAVGIIGSEDNPINLLYFAVIAVGLIGSFMARFQPDGMVLTMFGMAFVQALVAAIALIGGYYQSPPSTVTHILSINGLFITLFVTSALFFRHSAQKYSSAKKSLEK